MKKSSNNENALTQRLEHWKISGAKQPVQLADSGDKISNGEVFIKSLTRKECVVRALKGLSICWVLAAFAVFLPILHFLLVPGLLIVGPVIAYYHYNQTTIILGGVGECPNCAEKLIIEKIKEKWPLIETCSNCQRDIKIEQSKAVSA